MTSFGNNSRKGKNSSVYTSVHRGERLAEIHIGCQQPSSDVTQTLSQENLWQDLAWYREEGDTIVIVTLLGVNHCVPDRNDHARLQSAGMILVFQMELSWVCNHESIAASLPWAFWALMPHSPEKIEERGLESAWAMAKRRPEEYRHSVDAATRCFGVCYDTRLFSWFVPLLVSPRWIGRRLLGREALALW